jgi:hypothetical protein
LDTFPSEDAELCFGLGHNSFRAWPAPLHLCQQHPSFHRARIRVSFAGLLAGCLPWALVVISAYWWIIKTELIGKENK